MTFKHGLLVLALVPALAWGHPDSPAVAAWAPHGGQYLAPYMGGIQLSCQTYSGMPVVTVSDHFLRDVGFASPPNLIRMNPHALESMAPAAQVFWYGHECAHHYLPLGMNGETAADCWAVKKARDQGLIQASDIPALASTVWHTQGSPYGHPPGHLRVQLMNSCFADPTPAP